MDFNELFTIPGFFHICRNIFEYTDLWTLMEIRKVCKSWKNFLDNEMSDKLCHELSKICLNDHIWNSFQEDKVEIWKTLLDDLMKNNVKNDFNHYTEIMKIYWKYQKTVDVSKRYFMDPYDLCLDRKLEKDIAFLWNLFKDKEPYLAETCYFANENGNFLISKLIIDCDEDVNPPVNPQNTFLHILSESGHSEIVKYMLEKIEEDNIRTLRTSELLEARKSPKNKWQCTPLHLGENFIHISREDILQDALFQSILDTY